MGNWQKAAASETIWAAAVQQMSGQRMAALA